MKKTKVNQKLMERCSKLVEDSDELLRFLNDEYADKLFRIIGEAEENIINSIAPGFFDIVDGERFETGEFVSDELYSALFNDGDLHKVKECVKIYKILKKNDNK